MRLIPLAAEHPDLVLGFEDEVGWSREAQPQMHAWSEDQPLRLIEQKAPKDDPTPKALACYGLYLPEDNQMLLRFVQGRPVSAVTCAFLAWLLAHFTAHHKRALLLIWDNASWHLSQPLRQWVKTYHRQAKQEGSCRLILCRLPTRSPWLNPIEAKWVQGKRNGAEPTSLLSVAELIQRVCGYYHCDSTALIEQSDC